MDYIYCTIFVNRMKVLCCEVADLMVSGSAKGLALTLSNLYATQQLLYSELSKISKLAIDRRSYSHAKLVIDALTDM